MKSSYWLFLACFTVFTAFFAGEVSGERKVQREKIKIEDVDKKIRQKKRKIKKVEQEEANVISKLNKIEIQLLKENRGYNKVNKKIEKIQKEIRKSRIKIEKLKKQTGEKELYLKKRLNALYKYYRRSGLRILLSSSSYNEFLKQEKFLGEIVSKDHDLFKECLDNLKTTRKYQNELNSKKEELLKAKRNLLKKRNSIKESQKKKLALLKKIKREKSLQIKALKELEKYSKELQTFVERLPKEKLRYKSSRKKFSKLRGKLDFPVKGEIISRFGRREHPELRTFTFQKGIEIKASYGTEIKAVYEGKVVFSDWFKGYGYIMIIDHGENYYSLSAHASELFKKVDDIVTEGETIALVGDTSSIKGSCLYFEIRYHGKPQNPLKWLKKGGNRL